MSKKLHEVVSCWGVWELPLPVRMNNDTNSFDIVVKAVFQKGNRMLTVFGFFDGFDDAGCGMYKIRFMPDSQGEWIYSTVSNMEELDGHSGSFICVLPAEGSHGVARVRGSHFVYDDGSPLYPIGTTCYAWVHQPEALRRQTLKTLQSTRFKKVRMCVFPKGFIHNTNEPELYPFMGNPTDGFDFTYPNPAYYRLLEESIADLGRIGIEADLILFHPYDRWGFSTMDESCNHRYLRYVIARLSCYANIWWSLANEYDLLKHINTQDWESFARIIKEMDYANHLLSIHNAHVFYNHSRPWVSHCSIQRQDMYKTAEYTNEWIEEYGKPAVLDELGYEGDINWGWGNLSAQEVTRRAWECYVRGGYPGHGETFISPDDVLWWSKGGVFKGESHACFDFLTQICEETGGISYLAERSPFDIPVGGTEGKVYIAYFGHSCPRFKDFYSEKPFLSKSNLPEGTYRIDVIDTWGMTVTCHGERTHNNLRIDLPGKPYMAVRFTKI
jgi:hypothetical protein